MILEGIVTTLDRNGTLNIAPMGPDVDSVVAPNLRVRGLENLWIADASVMPDLISGNINAACMMIGWKAANLIRNGST